MANESEEPYGLVRVGIRISAALKDGDGERLVIEVADHIERAGLQVSEGAVRQLVEAAERQRR